MKNDFPGWKAVAAFTLIEMLIVVAIIGIISAAAIPRIQEGICQYRMNQQSTALFNTLRSLRFKAVEQDRTVRAIPYRDDGESWVEFEARTLDDDWEDLDGFGDIVLQDCVQLGIGDNSPTDQDPFDNPGSSTSIYLEFDSSGSPGYAGDDGSGSGIGGLYLATGNGLDELPDPEDGSDEACQYRTLYFSNFGSPSFGGRLLDYPVYQEYSWTVGDIPDCSRRNQES